jgi:hypothetical protein
MSDEIPNLLSSSVSGVAETEIQQQHAENYHS